MNSPFPPRPLSAGIRRALLCSILLAPIGMPALAMADGEPQREYQIAQGDLGQALTRFAAEAGVVLSFDPELTRGHSTDGLQGTYAVSEGLQRILAGSELQVVQQNDQRYSIIPAAADSSALELGAITVVSNQLGTITEGSGSYTPGTIATTTRLVLTPRQTPQTISVATRQYMDDFGLNAIDDVMRHTPGVSVATYDSERTIYYSRGFPIQNFQYDGIPTLRNDAYSAGATLTDMSIYDRVEVVKGAAGLLSGAGAPGATLNLVRKKPTTEFAGHVTLGAGSWDNYRSELDVSGSLTQTGNVRARAVASYQDKHSFQDNYQRATSTYYGIIEADITPDTLLTFGADYQYNDPEGSSWAGIPLFDSNGNETDMSRSFNPGAKWSNWTQYTRSVFASLEQHFSNDWVGKFQLNHQINGYDAVLGSASGGNPNPATGTGVSMYIGNYIGKTTTNTVEAYASGPFQLFGREHELVVGASASRAKWDNTGNYDSSYVRAVDDFYTWNGNVAEPDWAYSFSNERTTRQSGAYLTARFKPTDDLALIVGSRLANYSLKGDDHSRESGRIVPYIGAVYDLDEHHSAYASYTSIFNPQSSVDRDNKTLDPDTGDNYEIGLKGEYFNGRLNASIAYFEIKQDNRAAPDTIYNGSPSNPLVTYAYMGVKAETKGIEAEISGEIASGWQIQAGFTHKILRDKNGDKLSTWEPEDQLSFFSSYQLNGALKDLTLGGGARWRGKAWQSVTNPVRGTEDYTQKAYWLVDLMGRYQMTDKWSVSANLNNLLDKKYVTNVGFYNSMYHGEPRNFSVTSRWDF